MRQRKLWRKKDWNLLTINGLPVLDHKIDGQMDTDWAICENAKRFKNVEREIWSIV